MCKTYYTTAAALFSARHLKKFENERIFLYLEIAEIDRGGQFWIGQNHSGHKSSFFEG